MSEEPRLARNVDLKKAVFVTVDEVHIALKESYEDLTDQQFWTWPIKGRHNICTMVMHCLQ